MCISENSVRLLTGVQFLVACCCLRHRVVGWAILSGDCLQRLRQPAESVSGLQHRDKSREIERRVKIAPSLHRPYVESTATSAPFVPEDFPKQYFSHVNMYTRSDTQEETRLRLYLASYLTNWENQTAIFKIVPF